MRPSDKKPDILLESTEAIQAFLYIIGALGVAYVVAVIVVLAYRRHSKLVKASQPIMMSIVLLGEFMAFIRVIFGGEHPSPASCSSQFWLGHLAYVLVFDALTIKTWRVFKIISNKSLKRVKISNLDVLRITLMLISFFLVFLIIIQAGAIPVLKSRLFLIKAHFILHVISSTLHLR